MYCLIALLIILPIFRIFNLLYYTFSFQNTRASNVFFTNNHSKQHLKVPEDTAVGSLLTTIFPNNHGSDFEYFIPNDNYSEYFSVSTNGGLYLKKKLEFGSIVDRKIEVIVSKEGVHTKTEIVIEVTDVNEWEPRFQNKNYEFSISSLANSSMNLPRYIGKLVAADGDTSDAVVLGIIGTLAQYFKIDEDGVLWLECELPSNESKIELVATATDTGSPPRINSVPVTIMIVEAPYLSSSDYIWETAFSNYGQITILFVALLGLITISFFTCFCNRNQRTQKRLLVDHIDNKKDEHMSISSTLFGKHTNPTSATVTNAITCVLGSSSQNDTSNKLNDNYSYNIHCDKPKDSLFIWSDENTANTDKEIKPDRDKQDHSKSTSKSYDSEY